MKQFTAGLLFLILTACAQASDGSAPLPADIQAQVDGAQAGGQVSAAQTLVARGQATVMVATAQAQASRAAEARTSVFQTDVAAVKTADFSARLTDEARAYAAQTSAAYAIATSERKLEIAKTETAAAVSVVKTEEASARSVSATQQAAYASTSEAKAQATATWAAAAPTRLALARAQANEEAQQNYDREFADAYRTQALELAPTLGAVRAVLDELTLPFFLIALGAALLFGLVRALMAGTAYLRALAAYREGEAAQKRLAMGSDGVVVGIIVNQGGNFIIRPLEAPKLPEPEYPVQDIQQLEAPRAEVTETHAYNTLIGGFHYTSLLAFTRTILQTGDWSQKTWCASDVVLPRGFKLTTDTYDAHGNFVEGTYSRLLRLFVEHNLILGRRHGASGRWNPNAPTDADGVIGILAGNLPLPALPDEPVPVKRTRRKTKLAPVTN